MKYTTLKEKVKKKFGEEFKEKFALITHYITTGNEKYYSEAKKYFPEGFKIENFNWDWQVPFLPDNDKFTFVDLFAGIGGMRLAFQKLGGECVFSSEWDKFAQLTYEKNYGEFPFGDITDIDEKRVPNHEILLAGFPCQAFSIAGERAGFEDTRGTLFFDTARIIKEKKPKAFLLENVKGLMNHDGGTTLDTILKVLKNDLNYYVPEPEIINAKNFGVPQNRPRVFIVGFRKDLQVKEFDYPDKEEEPGTFVEVMEEDRVSNKYYLSNVYLNTLKEHKERHRKKGNGFGYEVVYNKEEGIDRIANTIVTGGMGRERNLVKDNKIDEEGNREPVTNIKGKINEENIRRMTPREWARLQGYPDKFDLSEVSDTQAYKQLGNSVAVPAVKAVGKKVVNKVLDKTYKSKEEDSYKVEAS